MFINRANVKCFCKSISQNDLDSVKTHKRDDEIFPERILILIFHLLLRIKQFRENIRIEHFKVNDDNKNLLFKPFSQWMFT